jgi:hypothetical protein
MHKSITAVALGENAIDETASAQKITNIPRAPR